MNDIDSKELSQYVAEQVVDYIEQQTTDNEVSSEKMEILRKGVVNICVSGYPNEKAAIAVYAPKLVRATLELEQISSTPDKAMKLVDAINQPKNQVIVSILENIPKVKDGTPDALQAVKKEIAHREINQKQKKERESYAR